MHKKEFVTSLHHEKASLMNISETFSAECLSEENISEYLSGVLTDDLAGLLEQHLSKCESCRQLLVRVIDVGGKPPWLSLISSINSDSSTLGRDSADSEVSGFSTNGGTSSRIPVRTSTPPLPAGFTPIRWLGSGGSGEVWEVYDEIVGRSVAVKFLRHSSPGIDEIQRLMHEASALGRLQHPGIVRIFEVSAKERPAILMELIRGVSLAQLCAGRAWPDRDAASLVAELADAIHHAHLQGVIHRDLKPSNILLQTPAERSPGETDAEWPLSAYRPMISDFGIARLADSSRITLQGQLLGTPAYMAPEQIAGDVQAITEAVDIYSLGVILYELLTGRPPYVTHNADTTLQLIREAEPLSPRALQPLISRDIENICLKCLSRRPEDRYASALMLKEDLQRFLESRPVSARPIGRPGRLVRWHRRNRGLSFALTASAVLLLCITAEALYFANAEKRLRQESSAAADKANQARELFDGQLTKTVRVFDDLIVMFGNLDGHDQTISPQAEMQFFQKSIDFFREYLAFRDANDGRSPDDLEIAIRLYWLEERLKPGSATAEEFDWISNVVRSQTAGEETVRTLDLQTRLHELRAMHDSGIGNHPAAADAWRHVAENIRRQTVLKNIAGTELYRHERLRAGMMLNVANQFLAMEEFGKAAVAMQDAIEIISRIPPAAEGSALDSIRRIEYSFILAQLLHADGKTTRAVAAIQSALKLCEATVVSSPQQQGMLAMLQQRLQQLKAAVTGESVPL